MTEATYPARHQLIEFLETHKEEIENEWAETPVFASRDRETAKEEAAALLTGLQRVVQDGAEEDSSAEGFTTARAVLGTLAARSAGGPSGSTLPDVSVLKEPVLRLWKQQDLSDDVTHYGAMVLATAISTLRNVLLEMELSLGADTILAQQEQLAELSTPVVKIWEGVLAIPLIGTLDSMRSQTATESLLEEIAKQQAKVAILDITGVIAVDTLVAQHLLKTAMAARLMGAECVISGIRPQIAQTMVQLGISLGEVVTRSSFADAFAYALRKLGFEVVHAGEVR
ncbi:STAS domain-containing protein [Saccharomonospora viridis]|jgi:rsbT co-antagonist protein RsbR|uniref:STAS domain-containing protein n=1 Tax=Saccharomonospora viridis TaxID=1852 RepID=UPI0023F0ADD7|nr:STAS domain-containing protein [Saccharomonospora viridis]